VEGSRFDAITRLIAQCTSRRGALQSLGVAGIGFALRTLLLGQDDIDAKKKRKKRKHKKHKQKKCKPPKGKCGKKCIPLNTNENCGRCGNRCEGDETCRGDVCCAFELCRGECRQDCPPLVLKRKFPQQLGYGESRPTGEQSQLNADVEAAYDRWKSRYLVREDRDEEGHQVFRVAFGKPGTSNFNQTVSEGQGFGMIIMAIMAGYEDEAQEIFDGLLRFRLEHPSTIDDRLMDWKVPEGGGNDSAFDGDADIAYGLLLADAQWGSGDEVNHFNYLEEAQDVIAGIWDSTIGPSSKLPMLGDWVVPNGSKYNQNTPRTSDFMPGHFKAFDAVDAGNNWGAVVAACQSVITQLQEDFSPDTGLLPDFAVLGSSGFEPAPPGFLEGPTDGSYNYNAGRDPWRIGTDALLSGDPISAEQASKIAEWANGATGGDPQNLRSGYRLDGTPLPGSDYFSTFFAAPIGVAAMTTDLQDWLDAIYDAVYDVQEDYYEDTVTLLCLLVMTGNFWMP
jgi:endoglucanase